MGKTDDAPMKPRELTPAEKFDRLFTSLIRVPKAEIDQQENKRQRAKKRAKKTPS